MTSIRTFGSPTNPPRHLSDESIPKPRTAWAPVVLGELVDPLDKSGSTDTSPSVTDFGFPESEGSSRTSAGSPHVEALTGKEDGPAVQEQTSVKGKRKSVPWTISMRDLDSHAKLPSPSPLQTRNPEPRYIPVRTSSKAIAPTVGPSSVDVDPPAQSEAQKEARRPSDQTTFNSRFSLSRTDEETGYETFGSVGAVPRGANVARARAEETQTAAPCGPSTQRKEGKKDAPVDAGLPGISTRRRRRRTRKLEKAAQDARFLAEAERLPTKEELAAAGNLQVFAVNGRRVAFRDVLSSESQTICVFIRHWYCPLCAEYVESIVRTLNKETLDVAGVKLVIIGNGSRRMLPAYRKALQCPFDMYTDPTLDVYRSLGMTRQTHDPGEEDEKGDYVTMGTAKGTWKVVKRATKMPLGRPGTIPQLGGEFIFKSSEQCTYAHRMTTTRSHAPIRDIVALAGVRLDFIHTERGASPPALHRADASDEAVVGILASVSKEERDKVEERRRSEGLGWKVDRENELERIREARHRRRSENRCDCEGEPGRASV